MSGAPNIFPIIFKIDFKQRELSSMFIKIYLTDTPERAHHSSCTKIQFNKINSGKLTMLG